MEKQFLIAGFGGQGVLLIGQLIAKAAMKQDYEVSWMPSYGPEMRGGEANCAVVISDEPIGSPLVSEPPVLIAMNKRQREAIRSSKAWADTMRGGTPHARANSPYSPSETKPSNASGRRR